MKVLAAFYLDCGRMGDLDGLFITTRDELESLDGETVYFGEVLGKHSEIDAKMQKTMFTIKSDDQSFIDKLEEIIGSKTISGFNPFDYIEGDEE